MPVGGLGPEGHIQSHHVGHTAKARCRLQTANDSVWVRAQSLAPPKRPSDPTQSKWGVM